MRICYHLKLCFFMVAFIASPLSADEIEMQETDQMEDPAILQQAEDDASAERQNWLFAAGSLVAAAVGIVVVAWSQGKTAHN